jgi:hypothetical protein
MTKLRNQLLKLQPDLVVKLRNVRINGALMGCSGFVIDPGSGRIVYVNTDHNHGTRPNDAFYRTAESDSDYTGGRNRFSTYDELPSKVVELLGKPGEFRGRDL